MNSNKEAHQLWYEYSRGGDKDCFIYWIEYRTNSPGGGLSFKFGIYNRADSSEKKSSRSEIKWKLSLTA